MVLKSINKNMEDTNQKKQPEQKPNEDGQILVDEHIKIFDPVTGEVFLDKRETN